MAMGTVSCSLMTTPDRPPYTSFLIRNKLVVSPPISTTERMLMPEDTTLSVFGAIMAEEIWTMGSSECSQLLLVQPWISVCLHREK
jgi:hypothetical protein